MWVLVLEAGMALFLLIFIVWWTMFHGRSPESVAVEKTAPTEDDAPD